MNDDILRAKARATGLACNWTDYRGVQHSVDPAILRTMLDSLSLPDRTEKTSDDHLSTAWVGEPFRLSLRASQEMSGELIFEDGTRRDVRVRPDAHGELVCEGIDRPGYYQLAIASRRFAVAVAPHRAWTLTDATQGRKAWGLTAQVYGLRESGDGGIGTFRGVESLGLAAARNGADAIAISPTHALFHADPAHFSPYSPSSRLMQNPLHADIAATFNPADIAGVLAQTGLSDAYARLEGNDLVDWSHATVARQGVLRALFDMVLKSGGRSDDLRQDFARFVTGGGDALRDHARFEALHAFHFRTDFTRWHWRSWNPGYQNPVSSDVERFAREHASDVAYHQFLQWLAERSRKIAQDSVCAAGMRVGIIGDLAVGVSSGGSQVWGGQKTMLRGLEIGAPPDPLAPRGQTWGLTTFSPEGLRQSGFGPFIAMLRAMFRACGGVRIDHAMGLARLWLVPDGMSADCGSYLAYPFEDLLRLVVLESVRHRAVVIAEDLGTVPDRFRERLAQAGIYGMRVMPFERNAEGYFRPEWYPPQTAAMTSTHDIATVAGWWRGSDLEMRDRLNHFGVGQTLASEQAGRSADRPLLWDAFGAPGAPEGRPAPDAAHPSPAVDAAVNFLARTASSLALAPLEDLLGESQQPNLPGTTDEHPNWRRRYGPSSGRLLDDASVRNRLAALRRERPRSFPQGD